MRPMPRDPTLEAGPALLREGYDFIARRCRTLESDVFVTRLLLQDTICLHGEEGAELFYDRDRFVRSGAMPEPLRRTLIGDGGVQTLDGERHRRRKAMFMEVMDHAAVGRIADRFEEAWRRAATQGSARGDVRLFDAAMPILCRAACDWAGVPVRDEEIPLRTAQMAAMIDGAGSMGPRHVAGRAARRSAEAWAAELVERVRRGEIVPEEGTALDRIARFVDVDERRLDARIAAVELLNVIRPIVAIARYVAFAAVALHDHAAARDAVRSGRDEDMRAFVHEVRRYYPFFPLIAARVREDFVWRGYRFPAGVRTLLDLHGTDRDPGIWGDADAFRPDRFHDREPSPYAFVPQGGGDHELGHRCAGEWITIGLVKRATEILTRRLAYEVPPQDLTIDVRRMPAIPRSRFAMRGVRWIDG